VTRSCPGCRRFPRFLAWLIATVVYPMAQPELAFGQPVSVGVRGGWQLIDWYKALNAGPSGVGTDESSKGAVGPFVSLKLPARLALQVEGLRRGYGFNRAAGRLGFFNTHDEAGTSWDIPALLIWRPPYQENGWQPYVGAGPALRYVNADWVEVSRRPQLFPTDPPASETRTTGHRSSSKGGVVATAGMERRFGPIVVSTELRYARWTAATLLGDMVPNRNQVSVLFGIGTR
jgi:hypothetical protein